MKRFSTALVVLGLVIMGSGMAWAYGPCAFGAPGKPVTEEQQAQLQETWGKFMNATQDARTQIATKMEQLKTLYSQPKPDRNKIAALQVEIVDLRASMAKQVIAMQTGLNDDLYGVASGMCMRMLNERGMGGWMHDGGPRGGRGDMMGPDGYGPRHHGNPPTAPAPVTPGK